MSSPFIISVHDLSFSYPDGRKALDEINLLVERDERVALVGPNGAGKSTLMLHLNGILRSKQGSIRIDDLRLEDSTLGQIRARLGLVFQNPDDQLFSPRVFDDVAFGPLHMGLSEDSVRDRVQRALHAVGMDDYADRSSFHLSVGEKKRIAIATVLSMDPKILVLDEPTAGLDPRARRDLIHLMRSLDKQTLLISTHDMRLVAELCSRTVLLDGGRIIEDGPTGEILFDRDLMEAHGLETP